MTTSIQNSLSQVLPTPKSRSRRSRAQKRSLVEQFSASGLTKTAFCKRHGIAISCLTRWQKALTAELPADTFVDITPSIRAVTAPRPAPEEHPHWQVELELGAGVILRVRTG